MNVQNCCCLGGFESSCCVPSVPHIIQRDIVGEVSAKTLNAEVHDIVPSSILSRISGSASRFIGPALLPLTIADLVEQIRNAVESIKAKYSEGVHESFLKATDSTLTIGKSFMSGILGVMEIAGKKIMTDVPWTKAIPILGVVTGVSNGIWQALGVIHCRGLLNDINTKAIDSDDATGGAIKTALESLDGNTRTWSERRGLKGSFMSSVKLALKGIEKGTAGSIEKGRVLVYRIKERLVKKERSYWIGLVVNIAALTALGLLGLSLIVTFPSLMIASTVLTAIGMVAFVGKFGYDVMMLKDLNGDALAI